MRGATETYKCKCCGEPFVARVADRRRGWARFCSKSCKAIRQTQRLGHGRPYQDEGLTESGARIWADDDTHPFSEDALQP